mmetsp:Transcript_25551/g.61549  ORF Transcript_25551/g.61549 Transcript_25551/m.61549 type:complete len:276 (-) Transcript_25551:91-918(-)
MGFVGLHDGGGQKGWKGWTLVMPAVSVGNVGQIAIDLLISTAKLKKVGYWYSAETVSTVCNDPLATKANRVKGRIALSVEFFESEKRKVVLMQRRAPLLKGGIKSFSAAVLQWAKKMGFERILLASSSPAYVTEESQSQKFWTLSANEDAKMEKTLADLKLSMKSFTNSTNEEKGTEPSQSPSPSIKEMLQYNTEITTELLNQAGEARTKILAVLAQVNEGDNLCDGKEMAVVLNSVLSTVSGSESFFSKTEGKFRVPFAYGHVYGPEPDRRIFT